MDYVEFEEYIFEQVAQQKTLEKLQEHVRSTATIDDDDVQAYYDQLLESQTTAYGEDASQYLTDQENFEMNGGDPGRGRAGGLPAREGGHRRTAGGDRRDV